MTLTLSGPEFKTIHGTQVSQRAVPQSTGTAVAELVFSLVCLIQIFSIQIFAYYLIWFEV